MEAHACHESNHFRPFSLDTSPDGARCGLLLELDVGDTGMAVRVARRMRDAGASYRAELPRCGQTNGRSRSIVEEEDEAVEPASGNAAPRQLRESRHRSAHGVSPGPSAHRVVSNGCELRRSAQDDGLLFCVCRHSTRHHPGPLATLSLMVIVFVDQGFAGREGKYRVHRFKTTTCEVGTTLRYVRDTLR